MRQMLIDRITYLCAQYINFIDNTNLYAAIETLIFNILHPERYRLVIYYQFLLKKK